MQLLHALVFHVPKPVIRFGFLFPLLTFMYIIMLKVLLHNELKDKARENSAFLITSQKRIRKKSGNFKSHTLYKHCIGRKIKTICFAKFRKSYKIIFTVNKTCFIISITCQKPIPTPATTNLQSVKYKYINY